MFLKLVGLFEKGRDGSEDEARGDFANDRARDHHRCERLDPREHNHVFARAEAKQTQGAGLRERAGAPLVELTAAFDDE